MVNKTSSKAHSRLQALTDYKNATHGMSIQESADYNQGLLEILSKSKPDQSTSDFIWKTLIIGIVSVFVGAAFTIAIGILMSKDSTTLLPMIAVFTTTVGILAPSPFQKGQSSTNIHTSNDNQP
jgi:hypothetical protein